MKTQTFGECEFGFSISLTSSRGQCRLYRFARDRFSSCRLNGVEKLDGVDGKFPEANIAQRSITWLKGGEERDGWVYGVKESDGCYHYECRYDATPADLEWMRQTDCNYLHRILKEGNLQNLEPDVWRLREMDHAQNRDIGKWWSEKLQLPNIGDLLANSAVAYQTFLSCEQKEQEQKEIERKKAKEKSFDQSYLIPYAKLKIVRKLGEGGFGEVYEGVWQCEPVAIKQLYIKQLSHNVLEKFKSEAEMMTRLHHPRIVTLYGVSLDQPGRYSLVMEYMPKSSLYSVLHNRHEQLDWGLRYRISMDICAGLLHLHEKNILHRDLKSMNVLLDDHMRAKLSDFGLSKIRDESTATVTKADDSSVGTIPWMAPELFNRRSQYTKESDIYSLGMVFWEIASRLIPFSDAMGAMQIIRWKEQGEVEEIPKDCPPKYSELIQWCWQDQNDRPKIDGLVDCLGSMLNAFNVMPDDLLPSENFQSLNTQNIENFLADDISADLTELKIVEDDNIDYPCDSTQDPEENQNWQIEIEELRNEKQKQLAALKQREELVNVQEGKISHLSDALQFSRARFKIAEKIKNKDPEKQKKLSIEFGDPPTELQETDKTLFILTKEKLLDAQFDTAEELLIMLLDKYPQSENMRFKLCYLYLQWGNTTGEIIYFDKGIEQCQTVISMNDKSHWAFQKMGWLFDRKYKFSNQTADDEKYIKQSEDCYKRAITICPEFDKSYHALAGLYYNIFSRLHKDNADYYYNLAIENLQKTLKLNPDNCEAYNTMGDVLYMKKQFKQAIEQYNEALERGALSRTWTLMHLGNAHREYALVIQKEKGLRNSQAEGQLNLAIDCYKKVSENKVDASFALTQWGFCLTRLGRRYYAEAERLYQKALALDSKNQKAKSNLAWVQNQINQFSEKNRADFKSNHRQSDNVSQVGIYKNSKQNNKRDQSKNQNDRNIFSPMR